MKKLIALVMILAVMTAAYAIAEEMPVCTRDIFRVADGYSDYFSSNDTEPEMMNIQFAADEYGALNAFTITINGQYAEVAGEYLTGEVYALRIGTADYCEATMFMVEDWGLNDYHVSYCFLASDGIVYNLGWMPGLARDIVYNADGSFTTSDRTDVLGTRNYSVDYLLATGTRWDEAGNVTRSYALAKMPKEIYPVGTICDLNMDLMLLASPQDTAYSDTILGGQPVILTATDMKSRAYVTTLDGNIGGWIWIDISDFPTRIYVGDAWQDEDAVFTGIMYAG